MTPGPPQWFTTALRSAEGALRSLLADSALLTRSAAVADVLAAVLRNDQKILICGNGGSACDAMHFAEELTGRFRADRPALAAIACTDPGHLTCAANDFGFDRVFSRWVEALGRPGDALIVLSTSGNSPNILNAARAGRERSMLTIALGGGDGGALRGTCDHEIIIPAAASERIQELHMLILHAWVEGIERVLI